MMNAFHTILTFLFIQISMTASAQHASFPIQWKTAGQLPAPQGRSVSIGIAGPITGTIGDFLCVGGGANFPDGLPWEGGLKQYYNDLFIFKPDSNGSPTFVTASKLPEPLAYAAICQTPQGIFVGGGENSLGIRSAAYLMDWDAHAQQPIFIQLPDLPIPLTNAMAASRNRTILLVGGEINGETSNRCFTLDLQQLSAGWKECSSLPKPVSHGILTYVEGSRPARFILAGGRRKNPDAISTIYADCYGFKPEEDQWEPLRSMPYAAAAGTGLLLQKNQLLLIGGDKGETFSKVEALLVQISHETDALKKEQLIAQKNELQQLHPGFNRECLVYDPSRNTWSNAGIIPYVTPVTTTALHWNGQIILPSGEIRAGVRTPLFLIGTYKP
jgi:N-acetylneuraminic acid mutarotase